MNRREALRSLAVGSAAGALAASVTLIATSSPADANGISCPILAAIEEHRRVRRQEIEADETVARINAAYLASLTSDPVGFQTSIGPMIYRIDGSSKPDVFGRFTPIALQEARFQRIRDSAKRESKDNILSASRAGIDQANHIYHEDVAAFDAARERAFQRGADMGLDAAEARHCEASQAEKRAWDAFISCPAETLDAVRAKIAYLLSDDWLMEMLELDGSPKALFRSLLGEVEA